jgi:hypothetical protein
VARADHVAGLPFRQTVGLEDSCDGGVDVVGIGELAQPSVDGGCEV